MMARLIIFLVAVLLGAPSCKVPLKKKIGQMLVLGFRGVDAAHDSPIAVDIRERHIGGVVLYDHDLALGRGPRNIEDAEQLRRLIGRLQAQSEIPLLVAIDQEGGHVRRLKEGFGLPAAATARELAARGLEATRAHAGATAWVLRGLGINMNLAPVVDLDLSADNPVIGKKERSYGRDPSTVAAHARAFVLAHRQQRVLTALKHFPGHGSGAGDTHEGLVDVTDRWSEVELQPFAKLIASQHADSIMTAHTFNAKLDPTWPATLSLFVIRDVLRKKLGFDGVVIADSMQMGAIAGRYGLEEAIGRAIDAGVDILLFGGNRVYEPDIGQRAVAIITQLVESDRISRERIDRSYQRIRALKARAGLAP